jgi:hypothetical protein
MAVSSDSPKGQRESLGFRRPRGEFPMDPSEEAMPFGIIHHFPGGTQQQYEASIAAVHPSRDQLPEGQTFHAAGPSARGWTIMVVFDSRQSWEGFRDGTLMPRFQQGIEGGFATPPEETEIDLYTVMP